MKKLLCLMLTACFILLMNGCFGKYELSEIGIVMLVGIDIDDNKDIVLSVICKIPTQESQTTSNYWLGVSKGKSVMEAAKNMNSIAMKKLLWFDNEIIVIGEKLASNGITDVIDFIGRNRENRFTNKLLIVQGTANELLQQPSDVMVDLPSEISGIISNSKQWSKAYTSDIREFLSFMSNPYIGGYTSKILISETKRNTFSTNRESYKKMYLEGKESSIAYIEGLGIFKNNKLVGWLNGLETRGLLYVINKIETGVITIENKKFGTLSVDIVSSGSKITPELQNGDLTMKINIKTKCRIVEVTRLDSTKDKADFMSMESLIKDKIKEEVSTTMKILQKEYGVDLYGFSGIIFRKYPKYWSSIESDWENIYSNMKINYDIDVTITGFGMISESITSGEN